MERPIKAPPINPLITPSASPPIFTSSLPSPQKRQRIPSPLSRSSTQAPDLDLHDARRSSSQRVMDAWSQLEDRYVKGLDEDDIIDLRADVVIKDRGILRATPLEYQFGCFGDAQDASTDDGDEEEDIDELDSFREGADLEMEVGKGAVTVPPVRAMDPADAEDLRAFLEAERRRKEECGDEEGEESSVDLGGLFENFETDDDKHIPSDDGTSEEEDDEGFAGHVSDEPITYSEPLCDGESEDDDEFGAWKQDEGSAVYQIPRALSSSPTNSDEIEIVEAPSNTKSHSKAKVKSPLTGHDAPKAKGKGKEKAKHLSDPPSKSRKRKRVPSPSPSIDSYMLESSIPTQDDIRPSGSTPLSSREIVGRRSRQPSADIAGEFSDEDFPANVPSSPNRSKAQYSSDTDAPYPYPLPYTPQRNRHQTPCDTHHHMPPPPQFSPIQDPQTQFYIAQAMQHLAFLINPTGGSHAQPGWSEPRPHPASGHGPLYPPPQQYPPPQWPYPPLKPHVSNPPSSSISTYTTPTHQHPYHLCTPSLSHGTLPPSSPEEPESPTQDLSRVKSAVRSRSRGRRVSFKLDEAEGHDGRRMLGLDEKSPTKGRKKSGTARAMSPSPNKGKGKAREHTEDETEGEARCRPTERAQTPGPPSQPSLHLNRRKNGSGTRVQSILRDQRT